MKPILIVTGSMISPKEQSFRAAIQKQILSFRASSGAWLDIQTKIQTAEQLLRLRMGLKSRRMKKAPYRRTVEEFFSKKGNFETPELTEVTLATLLNIEGLPFRVCDFSTICASKALRERLLDECPVLFISSTLLRDLSELIPLLELLRRKGNRIIVGGALTSMLHESWTRDDLVDVLAVGSGEALVPVLSNWLKGGALRAPAGGMMVEKGRTKVLFSGAPKSRNLDHYPRPNWKLAEKTHGRALPMVFYESVRGCPYRCSFCNYPYLFDDRKFRHKSALKIADDWLHYASHGVEYVTCLDSLFTMPKKRLLELCQILISEGSPLKWICYARADDLSDVETCELMREAGCIQVQIGLESGSQQQLDNMNKKCTVAQNQQALINCRRAGIVSVTTLILGFPGETEASIKETFSLLKETPPDLYYAAAFNTRFEGVPILEQKEAERFGLKTLRGGHSSIPYWRHDTMTTAEICAWQDWFTKKMAEERVALDGMLFFSGFLHYGFDQREDLLDFQRDIYLGRPIVKRVFKGLDRWAHRKLLADMERVFN